jgi:hypothetical protein
MWRGLPAEQKIHYAELARKFDSAYHEIPSSPRPASIKSSFEMKLTIPMISIVPRNGCSAASHQASLMFMDLLFHQKSFMVIHDS